MTPPLEEATETVYEKGTFYEFTLIGNGEVMFHVDLSDGATLAIYAYRKEKPSLWQPKVNGDGWKPWGAKWKRGKNTLFGHLDPEHFAKFAELVAENEFILTDDLNALIESGELPNTIFQNPIIAALRDLCP